MPCLLERHAEGFEKKVNQVPVIPECFQRISYVIVSYDALKEDRKAGKNSRLRKTFRRRNGYVHGGD